MVREIHRCRGIRSGGVLDPHTAGGNKRVVDLHLQSSRVAFFTGRALPGEPQARKGHSPCSRHLPHSAIESSGASVQMILPVVDWELILHSIEHEAPLGDSVAVSANNRTEKAIAFRIAGAVVVAQYD